MKKFILFGVFLSVFVCWMAGCATFPRQNNLIKVTGTVHYLNLEGGFWGIVADNGKHYNPVNLPQELQKEGLRAEFRLRPLKQQISFRMWGILVEVVDYKIF